jgi:hypothetical protein
MCLFEINTRKSRFWVIYRYARPGAGKNATQEGNSSDCFEAVATAAVLAALRETTCESGSGASFSLGYDESVFIVRVDPNDAEYKLDEIRNPYLQERRACLFGGLCLGSGFEPTPRVSPSKIHFWSFWMVKIVEFALHCTKFYRLVDSCLIRGRAVIRYHDIQDTYFFCSLENS